MTNPIVFISYSHDSPGHKAWVLRLATDLRAAGIDASLDQWDLVPGQDVDRFMQDGIAKSDRVLLVCTEQYVHRSEGALGGVGYERLIVTAEMIEAIETKKFIPIVRNTTSSPKIPKHLGPRLYIDFSNDATYATALERLCRELLGQPAISKPPLGSNPFSALIPTDVVPARTVLGTGTLQTGEALLTGKWFETERSAAEAGMKNFGSGAGMELRFALHEPVNKSQLDLLTAVRTSEVHTFGWPIGITLENRNEYKPRPFGDGIRAEIAVSDDGLSGGKSYDYWALTKTGDFYLLQDLFEDSRDEGKIFFNTRIVRVTESLMFAGNLYTHLGVPPETRFSLRVTHFGLSERTLASAGRRRPVISRTCVDDRCEAETIITLGSLRNSLVTDVQRLTAPLFMLFEFTEFAEGVYEDIVRRFENGESS